MKCHDIIIAYGYGVFDEIGEDTYSVKDSSMHHPSQSNFTIDDQHTGKIFSKQRYSMHHVVGNAVIAKCAHAVHAFGTVLYDKAATPGPLFGLSTAVNYNYECERF